MSKKELSNKEKALVGIGAAVAAGCRPCMRILIPAARANGACDRSIRLAIETGLYAGTCATRDMATWAESEQGEAPDLDATFRAEKEKLTALILVGATLATNATELLARYLGDAESLDWSKDEIEAALAAAHTVAKTAAMKIDSAVTRQGFSLLGEVSSCCTGGERSEPALQSPASNCGCAKGTNCT